MSVPFNQQRLQRDFVATIRIELASGKAVPGADLLCAVEQRMGPLPETLRELFSAFSIPAVRPPGRPVGNSAREDFGLRELDKRYTIRPNAPRELARFLAKAGAEQPKLRRKDASLMLRPSWYRQTSRRDAFADDSALL
jgi:hypothetical protein